MFRPVMQWTGVALMGLGLVGCNEPDYFDVTGVNCGDPKPGCTYLKNGKKMTVWDDPQYRDENSWTTREDNLFYDPDDPFDDPYITVYHYDDSIETYATYVRWYDNVDLQIGGERFTGYGWRSPETGVVYNRFGNAVNSIQDDTSRDIVGDVAEREERTLKLMGDRFARRYDMSADTGLHIAKTLNQWEVLGRERTRTAEEMKMFTKKLYGIELEEAQGALKEFAMTGSLDSGRETLDKVADHWTTKPETVKKVLKRWYGGQMKELLQ